MRTTKRPSAPSPPIMPFTGFSCSRRLTPPHPTPPRPNQHPSDMPGVFWNTHAFICVDNYPSCTHTQSHTHSFLSNLSLLLCKGDISSVWAQILNTNKPLIPPLFLSTPHRWADVSLRAPESSNISSIFELSYFKAFLQFPQSWDGEKNVTLIFTTSLNSSTRL